MIIRLLFLGRALSLFALALALTACGTAQLRDAQSHFSAGAAAENARTAVQLNLGASGAAETAAIGEYREAYRILDELLSSPRDSLSADGLLGTAKMLQIYSLWRALALSDGFAKNADTPANSAGQDLNVEQLNTLKKTLAGDLSAGRVSLGLRDQLMLAAMDGLIEHERGLSATTYDEAERQFFSAFCTIQTAVDSAPSDHGVAQYLRLTQLQTLAAWQGASAAFRLTNAQRDQLSLALLNLGAAPACGLRTSVKTGLLSPSSGTLGAQLKAIGLEFPTLTKDCSQPLADLCTNGR